MIILTLIIPETGVTFVALFIITDLDKVIQIGWEVKIPM